MDPLPPGLSSAMADMERTINDLRRWMPARAFTRLRIRWVQVERQVLALQAEVERLQEEEVASPGSDGSVP